MGPSDEKFIDNTRQTCFREFLLNEQLRSAGFARLPLLVCSEVQSLMDLIDLYHIEDDNMYGAKPLDHQNSERVKAIHDGILKIVSEKLNSRTIDMQYLSARFLIKSNLADSFIPPHQDRCFTDEQEGVYASYVCWIPLCDTGIENGTIGIIEGSHRAYLGSSPPSPDPYVPRYKDKSVFEIFGQMEYLSLSKGEAVVFNTRVFHGSLPNFSNSSRPAVRIELCKREATLVNYFLNKDSIASHTYSMGKYAIDSHFFINYSNQRLAKVFEEVEEMYPYPLIGEFPYVISGQNVESLNTVEASLKQRLRSKRIMMMVQKKRYLSWMGFCIYTVYEMVKPPFNLGFLRLTREVTLP